MMNGALHPKPELLDYFRQVARYVWRLFLSLKNYYWERVKDDARNHF